MPHNGTMQGAAHDRTRRSSSTSRTHPLQHAQRGAPFRIVRQVAASPVTVVRRTRVRVNRGLRPAREVILDGDSPAVIIRLETWAALRYVHRPAGLAASREVGETTLRTAPGRVECRNNSRFSKDALDRLCAQSAVCVCAWCIVFGECGGE